MTVLEPLLYRVSGTPELAPLGEVVDRDVEHVELCRGEAAGSTSSSPALTSSIMLANWCQTPLVERADLIEVLNFDPGAKSEREIVHAVFKKSATVFATLVPRGVVTRARGHVALERGMDVTQKGDQNV